MSVNISRPGITKGQHCKEFISEQIRKQKGTFENDWGNQIAEFGVYGKTTHTFVYASDTKKRYVHIYYSASKAAGERARLEESIQEMQSYLVRFQDTEHEFGPSFHKYFHLHYNKDTGHFVYGEPNLQVIRDELDLCGYFAIISSEKMDAKKAIGLYKNRDAWQLMHLSQLISRERNPELRDALEDLDEFMNGY